MGKKTRAVGKAHRGTLGIDTNALLKQLQLTKGAPIPLESWQRANMAYKWVFGSDTPMKEPYTPKDVPEECEAAVLQFILTLYLKPNINPLRQMYKSPFELIEVFYDKHPPCSGKDFMSSMSVIAKGMQIAVESLPQ